MKQCSSQDGDGGARAHASEAVWGEYLNILITFKATDPAFQSTACRSLGFSLIFFTANELFGSRDLLDEDLNQE